MILRDYSRELGLTLAAAIVGPLQDSLWDVARRELEGETVYLPTIFPAQRDWLLIGPFANKEKGGLASVYPPEKGISLTAKSMDSMAR